MPGRGHSAKWWKTYEAIKRKSKSKSSAAKITNFLFKKRGKK